MPELWKNNTIYRVGQESNVVRGGLTDSTQRSIVRSGVLKMIKGYLNYMINSATVGSKSVKSSKVEQTIASKTTFILS